MASRSYYVGRGKKRRKKPVKKVATFREIAGIQAELRYKEKKRVSESWRQLPARDPRELP